MKDKLAIIIVIYNNYKVLEDFFKSLKKQENKNFKLFIVDNSDHPQELKIKNLKFKIIRSANLGYAHGVNVGLRQALEENFELFCVINNDVFFEKDFVDNIFHSLKNHPESLIGGKIYYAPGYEYHKNRYSKKDLGQIIWYAGGKIDWNHAWTKHIGVDEIDQGQFDKRMETAFITGCLMVFDKSVLDRVGFWNESYFLFFEDADWCVRAYKKAVNLIYDPGIVIWHKNSESTGKPGSPVHIKYQRRSRLRFGLKYAPLRTKLHLVKNFLLKKT